MDHFLLAQVSVSRKMSQWSERLEDDNVGIDRWVIRLCGGWWMIERGLGFGMDH